MSALITATNGAGSTAPIEVLAPYETSWRGRNVVHNLIGGEIAVALVRPAPRSGRLILLYEVEADAFECAALHEQETSFELVETERPHLNMTYVLGDRGGITVNLNEQAETWSVAVDYQELSP